MSLINKKTISGRSMIEMLGVLAIIGILSAGGIWGYNAAMETHRINQTIKDVQDIRIAALNVFTKPLKNHTGNIQVVALHRLGIVPDKYFNTITPPCDENAHCNMKHLFNGKLNIYLHKDRNIYLHFYKLPKSACVKIATFNWGAGYHIVARSSAWDYLYTLYRHRSLDGGSEIKLTNAQAQTICNNDRINTIQILTFIDTK